jgi:hypothetical protein
MMFLASGAIAASLQDANALLTAGKYAEAKAAFTEITAHEAGNGPAWFGLGAALQKLGDDRAAVASFSKAVELGASVRMAGLGLVRSYARLDDRAGAIAALRAIPTPAPGVAAAIATGPEFTNLRKDGDFMSAVNGLKPCAAPEFRQFDFWLGEWDVTSADGTPLGRNRITLILGGCALQEQWTSASGNNGSSFTFFDPRSRKWHQFWIDDSGTAWLSYDSGNNPATARGTFHDGIMELISDPATKPMIRGTWRLLPDGRVRQAFELSNDSGATWTTGFEGFYKMK